MKDLTDKEIAGLTQSQRVWWEEAGSAMIGAGKQIMPIKKTIERKFVLPKLTRTMVKNTNKHHPLYDYIVDKFKGD